jgi:DNA-binding NarL/FixJ family response regulator
MEQPASSSIQHTVHDFCSPLDPLRLFILSDVRLVRDGLALLLSRETGVSVVGVASPTDAAAQIKELQPDIVLVDATVADMAAHTLWVREAVQRVKIVAFALDELDQGVIACAEAGVSAFVGRDGSQQDLLRAIYQAKRGEFSISPRSATLLLGHIAELADTRLRPPSSGNLTRRERQILPFIQRGLSNKEIARQLSVEAATVKNHIHNILGKLQLRRRAEIVALCIETTRRTHR